MYIVCKTRCAVQVSIIADNVVKVIRASSMRIVINNNGQNLKIDAGGGPETSLRLTSNAVKLRVD